MAALGHGTALWRVDVVLRRGTATDGQAEEVVRLLAADLSVQPNMDDEAIFRNVLSTDSYDMPPPEGSIGVSLWVRADTLGAAVQTGFDAVHAVAQRVTGRVLPLWDLRILPRSAVMTRGEFALGSAPTPGGTDRPSGAPTCRTTAGRQARPPARHLVVGPWWRDRP
jgi:hypothetical protein